MPEQRGVALFIFRRDFRLAGNPAWSRFSAWCRANRARACPCFVFTDRQTDPSLNPYFSPFAYSAMVSALGDLDGLLGGRLSRFRVRGGHPDTRLLEAVASRHALRAVFFNSDVTPFAVARDDGIEGWCRAAGVFCGRGPPGEGYTLWPAGSVVAKSTGRVPKVFSAFQRYAAGREVARAARAGRRPAMQRLPPPSPEFEPDGLPDPVPLVGVPAARDVWERLRGGAFDAYGSTRDDYNAPSTRMSVHLKFGALDPAAVFEAARGRGAAELERQLLWREFYYHLAFGHPELLTAPNAHIRPDRDRKRWPEPDAAKARAWLEGRTGEPLVDQAMRELRRSGFLHNRLRMVVSSYLVKEMATDWREGERMLATMLVDYDPAQNSGGWQAADAQVPGREIRAAAQARKHGPLTLQAGG